MAIRLRMRPGTPLLILAWFELALAVKALTQVEPRSAAISLGYAVLDRVLSALVDRWKGRRQ